MPLKPRLPEGGEGGGGEGREERMVGGRVEDGRREGGGRGERGWREECSQQWSLASIQFTVDVEVYKPCGTA